MLAYGVRLGLRVSEEAALTQLLERLPPGWKPASSPNVDRMYSAVVGGEGDRPGVRRLSLLYVNAAQMGRSRDFEDILNVFEFYAQHHVAELAPRRVFVHAGAVGWKGRGILVPGSTLTGKSTLTAELVRAGATYYSDEYAVLDRRGRVHPFPRPLSIRVEGERKGEATPLEAFGGVAGTKPLPVGLVVASEYEAGSRWRPRRLPPGEGVLQLLAHTISARRQPGAALETLSRVAASAPVLKGARGEARETARQILARLDHG